MESFASRLREALNCKNITQSELSHKTGISAPRISQYINGIYEPKQDGIYLISKALSVSIPWLLGYDVPMDSQLTQQEIRLLEYYRRLNEIGKVKAESSIYDLSRISDYTED